MPQIDLVYRGVLTDRSGTIAVADTSQIVAPAFLFRTRMLVQNPGDQTERLYVNFTASASTTAHNSVELAPGEKLEFIAPGFVTTEQVNVTAHTAGHAFVYKEA